MNRFKVRITPADFTRLTKAMMQEQLADFEPETIAPTAAKSRDLAISILLDEGVVLEEGAWVFESVCAVSQTVGPDWLNVRTPPTYWLVVIGVPTSG